MKQSKYSISGDKKFDKMLEKHLTEISAAVSKSPVSNSLKALILGGGYGRGEGGVFIDAKGKQCLYNDLDLFVIVKDVPSSKIKWLNGSFRIIGRVLTEKIGVNIDFGPAVKISDLAQMPFTMMWQELKEGHKVFWGPGDILDTLPNYDLHDLPRAEGVRLLLNRGVGLFFASDIMKDDELESEDLDFIGRNLYKSILACGDVMLLLDHQYCSSTKKRLSLLEKSADKYFSPDELNLYRSSVFFKFDPKILNRSQLAALHKDSLKLYKKCCCYFFSICYNLNIDDIDGLLLAFKSGNIRDGKLSLKNLLKNFAKNLLYNSKLDWRAAFSFTDPRLKLLSYLLPLLFEESARVSYTKFVHCWDRLN